MEAINKFCKYLIIATILGFICYGLVSAGVFSNLRAAFSKKNTDWYIAYDTDVMEDKKTPVAVRTVAFDDSTNVEVKAKCVNKKGLSIAYYGVEVYLTVFNDDERKAVLKTRHNMVNLENVAIKYRLDDMPMAMMPGQTEYSNQAMLFFYNAAALEAEGVVSNAAVKFETIDTFLKAKRLRVRLPLRNSEDKDVDVSLAGLEPFYRVCGIKTANVTEKPPEKTYTEPEEEIVQSRYGKLSVRDKKLFLNGKPVNIDVEGGMNLIISGVYQIQDRDVVLLTDVTGAFACQLGYHFAEFSPKGVRLSKGFGKCDDLSTVKQDGDRIFITTPIRMGPGASEEDHENAAGKLVLYTYENGNITERTFDPSAQQ